MVAKLWLQSFTTINLSSDNIDQRNKCHTKDISLQHWPLHERMQLPS